MLEKYLEYRFKFNNRNAYHRYYEEWVKNVTNEQLMYFEKELNSLIERGIYKPQNMESILYLPSLICGVITIALLLNIEKEDEWLGKIWCMILAFVFFFGTVFFTELTFNNNKKIVKKINHQEEFYDSHDYIY